MSLTDAPPSPVATDIAEAPPVPSPPSRWSLWARVLILCGLLVVSGLLRLDQMRRVEQLLEEGKHSPFPLADLPMELGPWKGQAAALDPRIAAGTGAVEHVNRRYVNQLTGTSVDVIVLYGPSMDMFIHSPEKCYPAAGYQLAEGPEGRSIPISKDRKVPFRSMVYTKGESGRPERQEVYFSWRYRDNWSPDVGTHKEFERIPGMYKVHLARNVTSRERRDVDNPCESLLAALLPEIERRSAEARAKAGAANPSSSSSSPSSS